MACSTLAFRSPMLKLAPACIGGYSMKLGIFWATGIWNRHISCLKELPTAALKLSL
jgi:hypothetical protein